MIIIEIEGVYDYDNDNIKVCMLRSWSEKYDYLLHTGIYI